VPANVLKTGMHTIYVDLQWRGLIHQVTDAEKVSRLLAGPCATVYAGFDPSSKGLHVGNLVPLLMLRRIQRAGHRPLAVVGGSTGMIGDPSGKSVERNLLSDAELRDNVAAIEGELRRFLDFDCGRNSALLLNNYDWMRDFTYLDFLRDIGKHFPVNVMLAKDSIKGRIEGTDAGMSYTEFSYMLLQAYDFVYLYEHHDCLLQVGGSDQWGNITAGIDLARRMRGAELYGMTCPLLTKADGSKMGKTESGAVWLASQRTSPFAFYQYWINVSDEDVGKCLRYLTELDRRQIEALDVSRRERPEARESQQALASELTRLVHGATGLAAATQATQVLFGGEIAQLSDRQLDEIFHDVPSRKMSRSVLRGEGIPLVDAFVQAGLASSKGEGRRIIKQGGAYVNNRREEDQDRRLAERDLASESVIVLRLGKKKYALLKFVE
jgi:tyrosyl-tRNA synthetase